MESNKCEDQKIIITLLFLLLFIVLVSVIVYKNSLNNKVCGEGRQLYNLPNSSVKVCAYPGTNLSAICKEQNKMMSCPNGQKVCATPTTLSMECGGGGKDIDGWECDPYINMCKAHRRGTHLRGTLYDTEDICNFNCQTGGWECNPDGGGCVPHTKGSTRRRFNLKADCEGECN